MRRNSRETQDKLAETGIIVEETLQGIFNVKAFVNEAFEIGRYGRSMDAYLRVALHGARLRGAFIAFIVFALFGSIVLVLWSGASLLQSGRITIGEMTRFVLYTAFVAGAMGQFAELYSQVQKAVGATQRVRELLQERPEFPVAQANAVPGTTAPRHALRGEVEFRSVHFRYPSRPEMEVLKGISFGVRPGEKIALVGPSGCRQVHHHCPALAFLRSATGRDPRGWPPRAGLSAGLAAQPDVHRAARGPALWRHHLREYRLWPPGRQ